MNKTQLLRRIRAFLIFFIFALFISGFTAIPLNFELGILSNLFGEGSAIDSLLPSVSYWITQVHQALEEQQSSSPFLAYGYDWLAFGHFVIAIAFIGPLRDPVRNRWVVEFAMVACVLVVPYAIVFGKIRGIPWFWRFIDSLFGIAGIIPLWITRKYILEIENVILATVGAE
jgi:hypothetical protein